MKRLFLITIIGFMSAYIYSQDNNMQLIRNATLVVNYAGQRILVDPMFAEKGTLESIIGIEMNPLVDLPVPVDEIIEGVDLILATHIHIDHFDDAAIEALDKSIKLINQPANEDFFKEKGFTNTETLNYKTVWNNITIYRTEAQHGTGRVLQEMGYASGFVLTAQNHPTIYIVGDAVWTEEIFQNILKFEPDYIIVNSGGAAMPGYELTPIIMNEAQTMSLVQESGNAKVIAVHMNAYDHCHTTRSSLKQKAEESNIGNDKLIIPEDGGRVFF